jgi:hypothetical protein
MSTPVRQPDLERFDELDSGSFVGPLILDGISFGVGLARACSHSLVVTRL